MKIKPRLYGMLTLLGLLVISGCEQHSQTTTTKTTPENMVLIPSGEFIMGSNKEDLEGLKEQYGFVRPLYVDEYPEHKRHLPAYWIDKFEVTNAEYKAYMLVTNTRDPEPMIQSGYNANMQHLQKFSLRQLQWAAVEYYKLDMDTTVMSREELLTEIEKAIHKLDRFPASGINWYEAEAYCKWQGKRLPSEAEWEKAARGTDGREFPWGNEWNPDILNTGDNVDTEEGIVEVGQFSNNHSPYGVYDMAGNVTEWVADDYKPYPGSSYAALDFEQGFKVARGGGGGIGHYSLSIIFRTAMRSPADPLTASSDLGFRCSQGVDQ